MPPTLDLHYVDELINAREAQHGGERGAPEIVEGHRVGASINRSCVVMLSALLQGYVEDVFVAMLQTKFPSLQSESALEKYKNSFWNWGNPRPEAIDNLFLRIGIQSVLDGLSWQKCENTRVKFRLNEINQMRNCIAHGKTKIKVNGNVVRFGLANVKVLRNFAEAFGERFYAHVETKAN